MSRHSRFRLAISLLLLVLGASQLMANYFYVPNEAVPIERLIRNLEAIAVKEPKNAEIRFNLARVHAMAFAKKMLPGDTVEVEMPYGEDFVGTFLGVGPPQGTPVRTGNAERQKEAQKHLDVAIDLYRQGMELNPKNVTAMLGYAWCLDQAGDRAKAVTAYRQVIAEEWANEQSRGRPAENYFSGRMRGWASNLTVEAAGYLIPLLDRKKDQDEIATLQDRVRMYNPNMRGISPITIPLSDDARPDTFIDSGARVLFDADGSGVPKHWTWITPEAAWLVHAPSRSRPVTSALQFFGNVTFWLFWENGYQALAALDDNGDGVLKDGEIEGLGLWRDANRNGIAEEGEVKPLAEWNIVSLNCAHEDTRGRNDYVAFSSKGVTFNDGRTRPTWDVLLYSQPAHGEITE